MNVENLIDELDVILNKAWSLPLSSHSVVDVDKIKDIMYEIKAALPDEVRQAKAIVADRSKIISEAKREAESIIRLAEEKARGIINQDELVKQAKAKANDRARVFYCIHTPGLEPTLMQSTWLPAV